MWKSADQVINSKGRATYKSENLGVDILKYSTGKTFFLQS